MASVLLGLARFAEDDVLKVHPCVAGDRISLLFQMEQHTTARVYHALLFHLPFDGHLAYFHLLFLGMGAEVSVRVSAFPCFGGTAGPRDNYMSNIFREPPSCLTFPSRMHICKGSVSPHPCQHVSCCLVTGWS